MENLVIKNGHIIDGTGAPPYKGDIVIFEEEIAEVGPDLDLDSGMPSIDASDFIVCPGFIDTHSHSDFSVPIGYKCCIS